MDLCAEPDGDKPELDVTWSDLRAELPWTSEQEPETTAGMRVFTSVMLRAWRQRGADVRRLQKVVEHLQRKTMYSKNDLHVSNALMRVEQKRCLELQLELKRSTLSISQARSSCEQLTTSVRSLSTEKEQLESDLSNSRNEFVELQRQANETADNLQTAQVKQRHLKLQLSMERAKVQQLMEENQQLLQEAMKMQSLQKREDAYLLELEEKNGALRLMRSTTEILEQELRRDRNMNFVALEELCLKRTGQQENHNNNNIDLPPSNSSSSDVQMVEEYKLGQLFSKIQHIISSAALFLLFVLLPNKSVRNGCAQPKNRQTCHK